MSDRIRSGSVEAAAIPDIQIRVIEVGRRIGSVAVFAKSSSSPRIVIIVIADLAFLAEAITLLGVAIEVAEYGEIDKRSSLKFNGFASPDV